MIQNLIYTSFSFRSAFDCYIPLNHDGKTYGYAAFFSLFHLDCVRCTHTHTCKLSNPKKKTKWNKISNFAHNLHNEIAIGLIFKSFTFEMIKHWQEIYLYRWKLETNSRKRYYQWNKSKCIFGRRKKKKRSCTQMWFHSTVIRYNHMESMQTHHRKHTHTQTLTNMIAIHSVICVRICSLYLSIWSIYLAHTHT